MNTQERTVEEEILNRYTTQCIDNEEKILYGAKMFDAANKCESTRVVHIACQYNLDKALLELLSYMDKDEKRYIWDIPAFYENPSIERKAAHVIEAVAQYGHLSLFKALINRERNSYWIEQYRFISDKVTMALTTPKLWVHYGLKYNRMDILELVNVWPDDLYAGISRASDVTFTPETIEWIREWHQIFNSKEVDQIRESCPLMGPKKEKMTPVMVTAFWNIMTQDVCVDFTLELLETPTLLKGLSFSSADIIAMIKTKQYEAARVILESPIFGGMSNAYGHRTGFNDDDCPEELIKALIEKVPSLAKIDPLCYSDYEDLSIGRYLFLSENFKLESNESHAEYLMDMEISTEGRVRDSAVFQVLANHYHRHKSLLPRHKKWILNLKDYKGLKKICKDPKRCPEKGKKLAKYISSMIPRKQRKNIQF